MDRQVITPSIARVNNIISASGKRDADIIYLNYEDDKGGITKLQLDPVSANGLRIAIGALQKIPRLVLPVNKAGEYMSHFLSVEYDFEGTLFYKKDQETKPLGKYVDIEDGLIAFNKDDTLWVAFSTKKATIDKIAPKKYLVLAFPERSVLEKHKEILDKKIFPFERFGKTNKLSYGYFHTIKEEA